MWPSSLADTIIFECVEHLNLLTSLSPFILSKGSLLFYAFLVLCVHVQSYRLKLLYQFYSDN